jgi:hypothetical protein
VRSLKSNHNQQHNQTIPLQSQSGIFVLFKIHIFVPKNKQMSYQKLQVARAAAVTPSDTVDIPSVSTQSGIGNNGCVLYVGGSGDVRVLTAGGDDVTFVGINGGTFVPVQVLRVWATGTTATSIIALW